jgi:hypothetical protein
VTQVTVVTIRYGKAGKLIEAAFSGRSFRTVTIVTIITY